jgi:hypothetical protein
MRPWLIPAGLALGGFVACATASRPAGGPGGDDDAGDASSVSSDDASSVSSDDGSFGDVRANDCATTHCSADLHQVLDCNDQVIATCPPDQGCGPGGGCVASCDSAKANQTTIGCDFFALNPAPDNDGQGSCYAVLIANTWTTPVSVQVEYAGKKLAGDFVRVAGANGTIQPLSNGQLAAGKVGVVFLSAIHTPHAFWTPCPDGITPAVSNDYTYVHATALGKAFHVTTSAPIAAYDIYPYGGAKSYITSASLLLPTPAWGTNYVAADGYPLLIHLNASPYLQIAAAEDGTHVTISPSAAIAPGTDVAGTNKGQPQTYALDKGQFVQFLQDAELAGSIIGSDKPVSVWGGSSCANIPLDTPYCDSLHQQLVPIKMLGHDYVAVRYRNRIAKEETVPWRFVGAVDGTTLTFDPPQAGAPTTLAQGQLVEIPATGPFSVSSQDDQHPFYVSAHMTGGQVANDIGDPDFVNIVPPDGWLSSYLFLTDPTYANTNLVFVRGKAKDGTFKDVKLDCAGTLGGWQPVGTAGAYEYTRADLVVAFAPVGGCNNGVHTAKSDAPFALTVWGFDDAVSYAFPAGMATQPINTVYVPPNPK